MLRWKETSDLAGYELGMRREKKAFHRGRKVVMGESDTTSPGTCIALCTRIA